MNLDFADIKAVMVDGGVSLIGMGESDSREKGLLNLLKKRLIILCSTLIFQMRQVLLVNIIGGPNMSLDECKDIIATVGAKLSPDAKLIWGAQISDDMDKSIRVLLIVTGVKSSQIIGHEDNERACKT